MNDNKTNLASGTIFDEAGYDEMQKAENHEIGFRLFRIMYFIALAFAFVLIVICSKTENVAGTAVSIAMFAVDESFYLIYAYMTAKRGIMNPSTAKGWSETWVLVFSPILFVLFLNRLIGTLRESADLDDIALSILWVMLMIIDVVMCLCAKKNNRVVAEQFKED